MNNKTVSILVIISLIFNLVLLSLFLYYRFVTKPILGNIHPPPHYPPRFENFVAESKNEIEPLRKNFEAEKRKFIQLLAADSIKTGMLIAQLEITLKKQLEMEQILGNKMIEIRQEMTDEEARAFFLRERPFQKEIRSKLKKIREKREKFKKEF